MPDVSPLPSEPAIGTPAGWRPTTSATSAAHAHPSSWASNSGTPHTSMSPVQSASSVPPATSEPPHVWPSASSSSSSSTLTRTATATPSPSRMCTLSVCTTVVCGALAALVRGVCCCCACCAWASMGLHHTAAKAGGDCVLVRPACCAVCTVLYLHTPTVSSFTDSALVRVHSRVLARIVLHPLRSCRIIHTKHTGHTHANTVSLAASAAGTCRGVESGCTIRSVTSKTCQVSAQ